MTEYELTSWLDAYGAAWESRDPDAAAELFTEDVVYHEAPFQPPAVGREGVRQYWAEATVTQREVEFRNEVLAMVGNRALVRWWASFLRIGTGSRLELDGILMLDFSRDGRCHTLREWWHSVEHPQSDR